MSDAKNVHEVSDEQFQSEVLGASEPVLVDFWAPWCGPCRMVGPIVEELADEYEGRLKVVKVNTDENQAIAGQLGIQSIPTLILFHNGQPVDRVVGAMPKAALQQRIEHALGAPASA
jgi:thioredoxin 1